MKDNTTLLQFHLKIDLVGQLRVVPVDKPYNDLISIYNTLSTQLINL